MIVVATKLDATTDRERLEKLRDFCAQRGLEFHSVSSASGTGIPELVLALANALDRLRAAEPIEHDEAIRDDAASPLDAAAAARTEDR
jgi:hypothetical protein